MQYNTKINVEAGFKPASTEHVKLIWIKKHVCH